MKDLTNKSGVWYLSLVLFLVCALATALMAAVALLTDRPIRAAKARKTAESLRLVLPEFDNDPAAEMIERNSSDQIPVTIYPARRAGTLIGYAVETVTANGYGGEVACLIGFTPAGLVAKYLVIRHQETPGIGTKVMDRTRMRLLTDLLRGVPADQSLPPNPVLDSYEGKTAGPVPWTPNEVRFISGATVSSTAARDLAWRASETLNAYLKERR